MTYKWNSNDKKIWDASEVLKEFEKRLARASIELAKKAQDAAGKIDNVNESASTAMESVRELSDTIKQDIAQADDAELEEEDFDDLPPTEEEHAVARESLINELRQMAIEASKNKNTKLAYKIERTVEELIFEG
jgi:hypothetical protein